MSQGSGFFKLLACDVASSVHDASVLVDLTILSGNSFAANRGWKRQMWTSRIASRSPCELKINQFAQETDARHGHGGRMCSVDCLNCRRIIKILGLPKCAILTNCRRRSCF